MIELVPGDCIEIGWLAFLDLSEIPGNLLELLGWAVLRFS
jgi:hypothetical protein